MRLIDADTLIDYLQMVPIDLGYREVEDIENYVKQMPTIEPERKVGMWRITGKEVGAMGIEYPEKTCTSCGWVHSLLIPENYCPRCGSRNT